LDGKYTGWADESDLVRATDEEVRAALAVIERKKEDAKWARIGRKPGEIKAGDIVQARRRLDDKRVVLGEVEDVDNNDKGLGLRMSDGKYYAVEYTSAVLVTPVEQRFDNVGA
jgi:hypothetical protein